MAKKGFVAMKAPARDRFSQLIAECFARLENALEEGGWRLKRDVPGGPVGYRADMVIRRGKEKYVVELRVAREARRPELPALLADAISRARVGARSHAGRALGVVGAPSFSEAWRKELAEYAARFFPGEAWGLVDGEGRLELHGPGLDALSSPPAARRRSADVAKSKPRMDPFADLGQWMAKVLLAPELPERYLGAPREAIGGPTALAGLAHVSLPSASRYLSQLRDLGFLAEDEDRVVLVRREAFFAQWRQASRIVLPDLGCRWLFPDGNSLDQLRRVLGRRDVLPGNADGAPRMALALFSACEQLGLRFVRGAPVHLYVEDITRARLEAMGLIPAGPGERADVFVREPRFPEAVFRAVVDVEGVPTADVLQCWLDVSNHPARGAEQGEQLWDRVIRKHLLAESS